MADNRPAALCSAMAACCWLLQKVPVESSTSEGNAMLAGDRLKLQRLMANIILCWDSVIKFVQKHFQKGHDTVREY